VLDIHRLRLLRELDRRGTLAAVARALSYSPSAISQQLTQLENETGVTLLEHVGRGVRLTEQALILVRHTDAILERLELAEADLAASMTDVTGTVRVASFQSVMLALVPAALSLLAERHPELRVEITHREAESAFAGLLAHDFDLVLGEDYPGQTPPRSPGMDEQNLALDEIRMAVPADGPWSRARLAELAEAPFIFDPGDLAPGRWARNTCRDAGFEPDVRIESGDLLLQMRLVETGHAVAFVPDLLWTDRSPGALQLHHLPGRPRRRLFTGVRSGAALRPGIRAFREALQASIRARD